MNLLNISKIFYKTIFFDEINKKHRRILILKYPVQMFIGCVYYVALVGVGGVLLRKVEVFTAHRIQLVKELPAFSFTAKFIEFVVTLCSNRNC